MTGTGTSTFVLVTGAVPGLGKTTLARRLAHDLGATLFLESDIGGDPAFSDVMAVFRRDGIVTTELLLDGARRFCATRTGDGRTYVLDSLFPYLMSLLAWGHDDDAIAAFFDDLRAALDETRLLQLHLEGDAAAALARATEREDHGWMAWMCAKHGVPDADALLELFLAHADRSRALLAGAPWTVLFVESRP